MSAVLLLVATWLVTWVVDSRTSDNETARGLTISDTDAGGLNEEDLRARVEQMAQDFAETPVLLSTPQQTLEYTAADLGLEVDVKATVTAALNASNGGGPVGWVESFFSGPSVDLRFRFTPEAADLAALAERHAAAAGEPSMVLSNGALEVVAGSPGEQITVEDLQAALTAVVGTLSGDVETITVEVAAEQVPPEVADEVVANIVELANQRTAEGLLVTVDEVTKRVQPAQLRSWLALETQRPDWTYSIQQDKTAAELNELFAEAAQQASEPVVTVVDDVPQLVSEIPAYACCEATAPQQVLLAVDLGLPQLTLALAPLSEVIDQDWLTEVGIVELVGQFTTFFTPGQSRVTNITRITELTQGAIIYPGETFSVNDFVGQRTVEKGFVPAGVISQGAFGTDVGGGISQYITTFFTAAFNAGMEFPSYQWHTIDIARYREGVDATISWPAPDFRVLNPTPYPVLLWPTVTENSVTMSLYSTQNVDVEWLSRIETEQQHCTRRTTRRSRTFSDGTTVVDSVVAVYQPAEGVNCSGRCITPNIPVDADGDSVADDEDEDGIFDICAKPEECPAPLAAYDSDDSGRPDICRPRPFPVAGPDIQPTPDPEPEPESEPTSEDQT